MAAAQTLPLDLELVAYSGTTFRREFRWLPDGVAAVDFTDWSGSMEIGAVNGRDSVLTLTTANGGVALTAAGQVIASISPTITAALKPGVLAYSLDLIDTSGTVIRFLRGRFHVVTDPGRSTYV